jgi:hypothetical protein
VARAHLHVEPDQVVRGEIEGRPEALDLERPRELAADAVRDAAGREHEERKEDDQDDRGEDAEADERLAAAPTPPDVRRGKG